MNSYNGFSTSQRLKGDKIIKKAIEEGKLNLPNGCVLCGQTEGTLHIHTENYDEDEILKNCVRLCWRCHMTIHRQSIKNNNFDTYFEEILSGKQYPPVYMTKKDREKKNNIK